MKGMHIKASKYQLNENSNWYDAMYEATVKTALVITILDKEILVQTEAAISEITRLQNQQSASQQGTATPTWQWQTTTFTGHQ